MERGTSEPTVLRRCTMDHTPAGHETIRLPPIDQHALATGPGRITRAISPSVIPGESLHTRLLLVRLTTSMLRFMRTTTSTLPPHDETFLPIDLDIDLPNGPYNVHRDYPPPPNGHDIMRIFPTLPPNHSGPTSSFFRQQEHLYFAHPGREIVRVCIESDVDLHPVTRSGFQREPWSVDGVMRRVALAQPAKAHDTVPMRPPLSHSQTHSDHAQYQNSLPYNTHTQYQTSLPFQQFFPYHQPSPPRQHAPEVNTYRITPVSSWQDKVQYHCFYHSYRHSDTPSTAAFAASSCAPTVILEHTPPSWTCSARSSALSAA